MAKINQKLFFKIKIQRNVLITQAIRKVKRFTLAANRHAKYKGYANKAINLKMAV